MTEPIAVDVPVKPAFPRPAAPAPAPAPTPVSVTPAAPALRVEAPIPLKPEAPKPAAEAKPALTPPPVPAPAPLPPTTKPGAGLLAKFTRKQLTIGATAVFGVVTGIGLLRLAFPGKEEPRPDAATKGGDQWAGTKMPAPPPAAPTVKQDRDVKPVSGEAPSAPPAPDMGLLPPVTPAAPPATAKPHTITPVSPSAPPAALPVVVPERGSSALPPIPTGGSTLPLPEPGNLLPVGGTETPKSPAGATPGGPTPPLPALPSIPGGTNTPPAAPVTPPVSPPAMPPITPPVTPPGMPPAAPPVVPPVAPSGMNTPGVPPPAEFGPITVPPMPKTDKTPDPVLPPVGPASPLPKTPVTPPAPKSELPPVPSIDVTPKLPASPDAGAKPPSVLPIDVAPKPSGDAHGIGTPTGFNKPAGTSEAKPVVPESHPKTSFDLDLHDPKAGDTYETISQEFYNDRRFAAALRAYNRNMPLQGGRQVEVPPIHILRKRFPGQIGGAAPVGATPASGTAPAGTTWGPAGGSDPTPARATGKGRGTFLVPRGGMTLEEIGKQFGVSWRDIYDLNPQYPPGTLLPAGTELKMP